MKQKGRVRFFHVEAPKDLGLLGWIQRQVSGGLLLILGIILALPYVPGPGTLFIALGLLVIDFPGKRRMISYLRDKRFFRITRILFRKKMNIFIILPKQGHPSATPHPLGEGP